MRTSDGALVVSLDFELLWGVFDKVDWREKVSYFYQTREVIPEILRLFQEYGISCTWATVGMLFNQDWKEWEQQVPKVLPRYRNKALSAYEYGRAIASRETRRLCFAPDLIEQIARTPGQEVGSHTYSHYYCLEPGQDLRAFREDLSAFGKLAASMGITPESLVFPRNQFNPEYLALCEEAGFRQVRSNPDSWYWQNTQKDSLQQKVFRTGDAYLGRNNKSYKPTAMGWAGEHLMTQKASRLLRPYSDSKLLTTLKMSRIKKEMEKAASLGEIYHLWWHPHNFGEHPKESLIELEEILRWFRNYQEQFGFTSRTMSGINNLIHVQ